MTKRACVCHPKLHEYDDAISSILQDAQCLSKLEQTLCQSCKLVKFFFNYFSFACVAFLFDFFSFFFYVVVATYSAVCRISFTSWMEKQLNNK